MNETLRAAMERESTDRYGDDDRQVDFEDGAEWMARELTTLAGEMKMASEAVDEAYGTSDYQVRLIALGLIARQYLRELEGALKP